MSVIRIYLEADSIVSGNIASLQVSMSLQWLIVTQLLSCLVIY